MPGKVKIITPEYLTKSSIQQNGTVYPLDSKDLQFTEQTSICVTVPVRTLYLCGN